MYIFKKATLSKNKRNENLSPQIKKLGFTKPR